MYVYIYIYIYIYKFTIVRLPHPWSGDNQGQEICNYDTECSKHHSSLSTQRSKGLSCSKIILSSYCELAPLTCDQRKYR